MQAAKRVVGILLNVFCFAATCAVHAEGPVQSAPDYAHERAVRAQGLTQPYGWFSLVALEWLKPGVTTVGSAKDNSVVLVGAPAHLMVLEQKDGKVALVASDPSLSLGGQPLHAGNAHVIISDREDNPSAMTSGTLRLWAIDRGGKRYLRVKDSDAPARKHFHGLHWYAPDRHYRVEALWIPYSSPHTMHVMNKLGQITPMPVPGYVEFKLDGKKQTLAPMEAGKDGLWFVFRDATALHMTDGGGRFLTTNAPSNGLEKPGTVTLEFNEAVNPPCAYSPYATCPLAAPENRLLVPVPAGEKRYDD
jgi:uncharacterized protein (DUF1684 family)